MPDTPADALTDIGLLTGLATLCDAYNRWEPHHEPHYRARMASYRARLERDRHADEMALHDG